MKRAILVLTVLFCSFPAFAKQETWYWGFGLGPGYSFYTGDLSSAVSSVRTKHSVSLAGDLVFYWPIGDGNTVLGPSLSFTQDSITSTDQLTNEMLGFSVMHSFGTEPGDGLFIRADVGFGSVSASSDVYYGSVTYASSSGVGVGATVGYGLPVSDETRLLFQLRSQIIMGDNTAGSIVFTFGPLF